MKKLLMLVGVAAAIYGARKVLSSKDEQTDEIYPAQYPQPTQYPEPSQA
jgi:hypothetical protein